MTDNPIFAVAARAEALRAQGADVISLAAGEPQAATSAVVVEAAVEAVRDPATHHYGPAQGDPALRALVATAVAGDTRLPWSADDVQIALGAKHALFLAVQALIDAGDEVLVAAPGWPGHAEVVTAAGGVAVPVATDEEFRLTAEALDRLRTARTRAVILPAPATPPAPSIPSPICGRSPTGPSGTASGSSATTSTGRSTTPGPTGRSCGWLRNCAAVPSWWAECPRSMP